jgi:hypothetical protein
MLCEPSECFTTNKMSLELSQGIRQDFWSRGIHKSNVWISKKPLLP